MRICLTEYEFDMTYGLQLKIYHFCPITQVEIVSASLEQLDKDNLTISYPPYGLYQSLISCVTNLTMVLGPH